MVTYGKGGDIMSVERFTKYLQAILPNNKYDFKDKQKCISQHIAYMLNRTQSMFRWSNLPDTINARILELYLQVNGNLCISEYNDNLYAFVGGLGGEPDVYYMPTIYTVANPALKYSKSLKIGDDCIVIPNDSMYIGLLPMFSKYASAISETEISVNIATINSRIVNLISAPDDSTFESAKKYIADIEDGKQGVIAENVFLDGLKSQPYGNSGSTNSIKNLIELLQYQKASWYNEIGLNANYNMKRESIMSDESALNDDALHPLIDNMLECRQLGVDAVNAKYGTNIKVELESSWESNQIELENQQENLIEDDANKGGENDD